METREFVQILKDRIEADPNLTVSGLAVKAGLNNSTIRQMIAKGRSPRIETAVKICRALGDTVETFLSEGRDPITREILVCLEQLSDAERRMILGAVKGLHDRGRAAEQQSVSASREEPIQRA